MKTTLAAATTIAATAFWIRSGKPDRPLTIDATLNALDALKNYKLTSTGTFSPFQIFTHLSQSVEFSMQGFPKSKPKWLKQTLGKTAFYGFSALGNMKHDLSEPIPGAAIIIDSNEANQAIERLKTALLEFEYHQEKFQPHFMYGELSRSQYTLAHIIHINNHLLEIQIQKNPL